jgi:peptidoglycan/LPS O-acetylase OafA/YrhL
VLFPIPFAAASWYLIEQPILKLKRLFEADDRRPPVTAIPRLAAETSN